jgi:anti-sigma B factor antagonist
MNLKFENVGKILVVNVNELKFTNIFASDFRDKMIELIDEENYNILINLEKVSYMDSSGLGAVISAFNHLTDTAAINEVKSTIAICRLNKSVEFLFSMLRINGIIEIFDSKEIALEILSKKIE